MGKLITHNFKTHSAKQFLESVSEPANTVYYMAGHKSTSFDNDASPPAPNTSIFGTYYDLFDDMIFGKRVDPSDMTHMIKNNTWVSNTAYAMYDDNVADVTDTLMFTVSAESGNYHVFKCLDNNGGVASIDQPLLSETSADDEFYQTSDGYQWKYMYTVTSTNYSKFATSEYIPVTANASVTGNSVSGAIETILITNAGINYNSYANGTIGESAVAGNTQLYSLISTTTTMSSNTDFYKGSTFYIRSGQGAGQQRIISEYIVTGSERRVLLNTALDANTLPNTSSVWEIGPSIVIAGDGASANAIATVNSTANSIQNIEIITRGTGYTYADITISGNTGVLANAQVVTANSATGRAIISPKGGHGSDIIQELDGSHIGISTTFANNEANTISTDNDFRKITLIKDPLFANVELTIGTTATSFTAGELITQNTTGATAYVSNRDGTTLRVANVSGFFETGNSTVNYIVGASSAVNTSVTVIDRSFTTFDQTSIFQVEITYPGAGAGGFVEDERVTQTSTGAEGYIHSWNSGSANSTVITLTSVKGTFALSDGGLGVINTFIGDTSGAIAKLTGEDKTRNKLTDGSGEFMYIETMQPVSRSDSQSEKVKIIISF